MKSKQIEDGFILRLEAGEPLVDVLTEFCITNDIRLGLITGLGAATRVTLGNFNIQTKEYKEQEFEGSFEITMLYGNISEMDGKPYLHIHATLGDDRFGSLAGHLKQATVGATCEITILTLAGTVERYKDEEVGLNLYNL